MVVWLVILGCRADRNNNETNYMVIMWIYIFILYYDDGSSSSPERGYGGKVIIN